jgi:exosortase family protein XrtF
MIKSIKQNPTALFLLKALGLYLAWYLLYELWLHPNGYVDRLVIDNIIFFGNIILQALGYRTIPTPPASDHIRTVGIDGTHGLWVGDPCNGITLFALFIGFIIAYPGNKKKKLFYSLFGVATIHLLNIIRVVTLSIITLKAPETLYFNHTYTFTIIVYGYVFLLWILWANKYSKL